MYSKAGLRITSQLPDMNKQFRKAADGNRLYKQVHNSFELQTERNPPERCAAIADWSWGGQFVDLTNDGFLDIYVSSGYYTAPSEHASDKDL